MAFTVGDMGLKVRRYRRAKAGDNEGVFTSLETKPFLINSRDYNLTTGDAVAFQVKPNLATTKTSGNLIGGQVSPRLASGVGGQGLVGFHVDATLKGTTGNLSGEVHVLEVETDFSGGSNPTRTITGDLSMIRVFADLASGTMTYSGKKHVMQIAANNTGAFDYFLDLVGTHTDLFVAATNSVIDHAIPIRVNGTNYWIGVYDATS